ncbi:histidine triad superfamily, third branch [Scheffersomyces amazonensis]|uniref:histidine triad superfamily, third branch n=1 Tax=Scheffersomyces amazonensis TaxID=1078765 RepID=UPI00315CC9E7
MSFALAFQKYVNHPEKHVDIIQYYDKNVVIIRDAYPKSVCHYLVIPRFSEVTYVNPLDAFNRDYREINGQELFDIMEKYVEKAKDLIIADLQGAFGHKPENDLKLSAFKNTFIKAGIHSIPSLKNLHIHVITRDFQSNCLKNKKHYNSFNTQFFVEFEKLNPTYNKNYQLNHIINKTSGEDYASDSYDSDDEQLSDEEIAFKYITHIRNENILKDIVKSEPLKCSVCNKDFNNKFQDLKKHLNTEYLKKYNEFEGFYDDKFINYFSALPR